jgi:hypothetical protein
MTPDDHKDRIGILLGMYSALARPIADRQVAAIASVTASIPLGWLQQAAEYLAHTWTLARYPAAPELRREASRLAGFRPSYNPWVDAKTPEPLWWPQYPSPVPLELSQSWALQPAAVRRLLHGSSAMGLLPAEVP